MSVRKPKQTKEWSHVYNWNKIQSIIFKIEVILLFLCNSLLIWFLAATHTPSPKIHPYSILVMGPGQKNLTRVGTIFCYSGRVSHLWLGPGFGKFPLKILNFSIFPLQDKKISSGRVKKTGWELQLLSVFNNKSLKTQNTIPNI